METVQLTDTVQNTPALPCGRPKENRQRSSSDFRSLLDFSMSQLNRYLERKALYQSDSRNKILEVILKEERHFNTNELVKKVRTIHPQIGPATIYRNIPIFLDAGIIRETFLDDERQKVYEVNEETHHDHIICLDCHEIFEFHEGIIEAAQEQISHQMNFQPVHHRHVVYAHCEFQRLKNEECQISKSE